MGEWAKGRSGPEEKNKEQVSGLVDGCSERVDDCQVVDGLAALEVFGDQECAACLAGGGYDEGIPPGDLHPILDQPGLFECGRGQLQGLPGLKITDVGPSILEGHAGLQAAGDGLVVLLEHLRADSAISS